MKLKRSNPFVKEDWWLPTRENPYGEPEPKWSPLDLEELQQMYPHIADDLKTLADWGYPLNPYTVKHLRPYPSVYTREFLRIQIEKWAKTVSAIAAAAAAIYAIAQWFR